MTYSEWIINRTCGQTMPYLNTFSMIPSVDLASLYGVSLAKSLNISEYATSVFTF